jgi:hypothetical protein
MARFAERVGVRTRLGGYTPCMFRDGPFPAFLHGLAEYIAGALFIALPLLLNYQSGAAKAVSIVIGVLMIAVAASTDWGLSLNNQIPKPAHFALDWILAAVLIASPFLFSFSGDTTPTAIFIAAGVLHILLTIGTRFGAKPNAERAARSRSSSSKVRAAAGDEPRRLAQPGEAAAPEPQAQGEPEASGTGDRSTARRT